MDHIDAWAIAEGAMEHFKLGEFEDAINLFLESIHASPKDPRMHFNLALALAKLGENMVALDVLKKGLDLDPHDKQALKLLALLHSTIKKTNRPTLALQSIAWIARFVKDKDFLANYTDDDVANHVLKLIIESMMDIPYNTGGNHRTTGANRAPAHVLTNTLQQDVYGSSIVMCYAHLSLPCLSGNDTDNIMSYILDNYEELDEDDKGTGLLWVFEQGRQRYEDADYRDAARIFEGLAAAEPTNLAILFYCGKALRDSGEMELVLHSIDYYKRILQLNYENALGWYDLSLSYAILGDFQKELFCLRRAADLGHSRQDYDRIAYLESITAPVDPFG